MKTPRAVIIGLGNPIRRDDAVGPAVARLVHQRLGDENADLREAAVGGRFCSKQAKGDTSLV